MQGNGEYYMNAKGWMDSQRRTKEYRLSILGDLCSPCKHKVNTKTKLQAACLIFEEVPQLTDNLPKKPRNYLFPLAKETWKITTEQDNKILGPTHDKEYSPCKKQVSKANSKR